MSTVAGTGQTSQQLLQDIQQELTTANQLVRLISNELQLIKNFTSPGGEFESNIKQNSITIADLANACHINMENIPPFVRKTIDLKTPENQNKSNGENNTCRNYSNMDDSN